MIISDYLTLVRECHYTHSVELMMRECLIIYVVVAPHPTYNIKELEPVCLCPSLSQHNSSQSGLSPRCPV